MGSQKRSKREVATLVGEGIAEAAATAAAVRAGWQKHAEPKDPYDRMALAHEREQKQYLKEKKKYSTRLARLKQRSQNMTYTAIGAGSIAVIDVATNGPDVWFWLATPVLAMSAIVARTSKTKAAQLIEPAPPSAPPPPPRPLPPGVIGAAESVHLHRVRVQLAQLMPTIAGLHEEAAIELRKADFEAAPALGALVDRLAVLHRVQTEMVGTAAADTARTSAEEIRQRLAEGVSMYEDLLNATLQMLSAPDPQRAPSTRLEISVQELTSYTEGLRIAAGQPAQLT